MVDSVGARDKDRMSHAPARAYWCTIIVRASRGSASTTGEILAVGVLTVRVGSCSATLPSAWEEGAGNGGKPLKPPDRVDMEARLACKRLLGETSSGTSAPHLPARCQIGF